MRTMNWIVLCSSTWAIGSSGCSEGAVGKDAVVFRIPRGDAGQSGAADAAPPSVEVGTGGLGSLRADTGGCGADCATGGAAGTQIVAYCGDGLINRAEEHCDDGNTTPGDGCTAACDQVEADWTCPTPGQPCAYTVACGDGRVGGKETCDDGVDTAAGTPAGGDGCSVDCQVEEGFSCPVPNAACRPVCADGLVRGHEQCDDGNAEPLDGCNDTCQLEPGWVCPPSEPCRPTVCGDGVIEGSEQCDDAATRPYDGCSEECTLEPRCGTLDSPAGLCTSSCGDGILLATDAEQCDDGNNVPGDGCSETCLLEPGYQCVTVTEEPPQAIDIPIVYRDFKAGYVDDQPVAGGHPDFERPWSDMGGAGLVTGIVLPELGIDRKPVYAGTDADPAPRTMGQTYFDQWYRDVDGVDIRIDSALTLTLRADGAYSMDSATDSPWADLGGFYPIDGLGWGNEASTNSEGVSHNFHFTSELRYWFEYRGGEELRFSGDDDVFMFINGMLAADLGGVHSACYAHVVLGDTGHGMSCTTEDAEQPCTPAGDIDFGLVPGSIYEAVVFQAERHTTESNYWLTLTGFTAGRSTCAPVCGDAVQTPDEACDLGADENTGTHGGCNADCTLAAYCGDGTVDTESGEVCDDGVNISLYGGCAPGCVRGPTCGDGQVQSPWEECDDGINDGSYGKCAPNCTYAPRCGDGHLDLPEEECDDGTTSGEGECGVGCKKKQVL